MSQTYKQGIRGKPVGIPYAEYVASLPEVSEFKRQATISVIEQWRDAVASNELDQATGFAAITNERLSSLLEELGTFCHSLIAPGDPWENVLARTYYDLNEMFAPFARGRSFCNDLPLLEFAWLESSGTKREVAAVRSKLRRRIRATLDFWISGCAAAWADVHPIGKSIEHGFKVIGEKQALAGGVVRDAVNPAVPSPWFLSLNSFEDSGGREIETKCTTVPMGESATEALVATANFAAVSISIVSGLENARHLGKQFEIPSHFFSQLSVPDQILMLKDING